MIFLIDTNVLVRLEDSLDPHHSDAMLAIEWLKRNGHECQIVPQVLYEFWAVGTRPVEQNGLGLDATKIEDAVREWMSLFRLRSDERGVFQRWMNLVIENQVRGKLVHDARLVAAMEHHGLSHLLTFDAGDFYRFKSIRVHHPAEILKGNLAA